MKAFSIKKRVITEYLDDLNHVNNVQYLLWVQEVAKKHWEFLAGENIDRYHFWVVRSHQIDYKYSAKLEDELLINTYVGKTQDYISERIVEIFLMPSKKLITRCNTK
jgi:acyl-CoA thioester hydrolase